MYSPAKLVHLLLVLTHVFSLCQAIPSPDEDQLQTYIVFVKKPEEVGSVQPPDLATWYRSFFPPASSSGTERLVYAYRSVMTGFAARLTAEEVRAMEAKDGFLSAYPESVLSVQTTHTPDFLGLTQGSGFWDRANYGKGLVIAVIDTGIAFEHPSFLELGVPPPPAKWKGKCEFNESLCTNKIIGARNFVDRSKPPVDDHGHGTHTASTAAGRPVEGAEWLGQYNGTAIGIAPMAHLAIYKVCDGFGSCTESGILAGMDAAIEDGADVLSLSLGGPPRPFYKDSLAIGAFQAIQKGVFVSCAAGNSGPFRGSLSNDAPWILTVGASTVDRSIRASVLLGNKIEFYGQSMYQPTNFSSTLLPLVYPGVNGDQFSYCEEGSLKNVDVKGKVVLCMDGGNIDNIGRGQVVKDAGGAAMIVASEVVGDKVTDAELHVLPAADVDYANGVSIKDYIQSESSPMATILFQGTVFGVPYAPQVATFSSRGPSQISPGILKPDILGPGERILAAWPSYIPSNIEASADTRPTFNLLSGTSMATPHLSGIAALLKSTHPDWSPAAIKSAILTTSDIYNLEGEPITDEDFNPINVFSTGSGQANPSSANDPGLVYDIQPVDYIPYLCGLNYTDQQVGLIVQRTVQCSDSTNIPQAQLNYPSFSIILGPNNTQTYTRTVTNVGKAGSSYASKVVHPRGVAVKVTPKRISFSGVNQKATFKVTFINKGTNSSTFSQGYLMWVSDEQLVRSPIAVQFI